MAGPLAKNFHRQIIGGCFERHKFVAKGPVRIQTVRTRSFLYILKFLIFSFLAVVYSWFAYCKWNCIIGGYGFQYLQYVMYDLHI